MSKIKRHVMKLLEKYDDYDIMEVIEQARDL